MHAAAVSIFLYRLHSTISRLANSAIGPLGHRATALAARELGSTLLALILASATYGIEPLQIECTVRVSGLHF